MPPTSDGQNIDQHQRGMAVRVKLVPETIIIIERCLELHLCRASCLTLKSPVDEVNLQEKVRTDAN